MAELSGAKRMIHGAIELRDDLRPFDALQQSVPDGDRLLVVDALVVLAHAVADVLFDGAAPADDLDCGAEQLWKEHSLGGSRLRDAPSDRRPCTFALQAVG